MSKFIAISYSILILIQSFNINLEDISKVKVLLEHAKYHKENYGDNFFKFLAEHYGNTSDDSHKNHKEHKDLPFKGNHHLLSNINTSFTLNFIQYHINHIVVSEILLIFYYTESHSIFEKTSIFQPPKFA